MRKTFFSVATPQPMASRYSLSATQNYVSSWHAIQTSISMQIMKGSYRSNKFAHPNETSDLPTSSSNPATLGSSQIPTHLRQGKLLGVENELELLLLTIVPYCPYSDKVQTHQAQASSVQFPPACRYWFETLKKILLDKPYPSQPDSKLSI